MHPVPKVVIVVSRDFGELTNALTFARSPGLRVTLLLPDNLFASQTATLGISRRQYTSLGEVQASIDALQPDVVMLFSGYLFVVSRLFEFPAFEQWMQWLEKRQILVMTSDPFLGLLQSSANAPFETRHPASDWMRRHFERVAGRLRSLMHVYTAPCGNFASQSKAAYGFPQSLLRESSRLSRAHRLNVATPPLGEDSFWLYILSSEDFQIQTQRWGGDGFIQHLALRMADANATGRLPVLIAPPACVQALLAAMPAELPCSAIPFCDAQRFEDLMLAAQHVFFWNHASNSILLRLVNALPVWFFDQGHLLRMVPGLRDLALDAFYGGFGIQEVALDASLDRAELDRRADATQSTRTALAVRYLALNRPVDLILRAMAQHLWAESRPLSSRPVTGKNS